MALTAGGKLGNYEILALIGKGGMGEVYRARDPRLDRWPSSGGDRICRPIKEGVAPANFPLHDSGTRLIDPIASRFPLMFLRTGVISVTTANAARRNSMSENAIDSENSKPTPATAKPEGARKAGKKAKLAKKARPSKETAAKPAAERSNKKFEVMALMKRAKGVTR